MGLAMGLAFYYSWQLTLIVLATVPIMAFSGIIETKSSFQASNSDEVKQAYAMAAQTSCDAIQNIRTVKAMNSESRFVAEYQTDIDVPHQKALKSARYGSLGYGMFSILTFLTDKSTKSRYAILDLLDCVLRRLPSCIRWYSRTRRFVHCIVLYCVWRHIVWPGSSLFGRL